MAEKLCAFLVVLLIAYHSVPQCKYVYIQCCIYKSSLYFRIIAVIIFVLLLGEA